MESIMQNNKECWICGKNGNTDPLEMHHIFGGPNRKYSEKYGLKVWLCGCNCHRLGPNSVHMNKFVANVLKHQGQAKFEEIYPSKDFVSIFGRNYL